jgi:hypothetical protein
MVVQSVRGRRGVDDNFAQTLRKQGLLMHLMLHLRRDQAETPWPSIECLLPGENDQGLRAKVFWNAVKGRMIAE